MVITEEQQHLEKSSIAETEVGNLHFIESTMRIT